MKLVRVCMVVLLNLLKLFGAIFFFFWYLNLEFAGPEYDAKYIE